MQADGHLPTAFCIDRSVRRWDWGGPVKCQPMGADGVVRPGYRLLHICGRL